jgi:hypothetical protein
MDEGGGVFERWRIGSVELSLGWEKDVDPSASSLGWARDGVRVLLVQGDHGIGRFCFDDLNHGQLDPGGTGEGSPWRVARRTGERWVQHVASRSAY